MKESVALCAAVASPSRIADFASLAKPRIVLMVLMTSVVGFYLGSGRELDYARLLASMVGIGLAAGGTLALNQYLERDVDAKMRRTRMRPLPAGRLQPTEALAFGVALTGAGLVCLMLLVNPLSAVVTAATTISYLFVYTPMKRTSALCMLVGAVPGALPPVSGWAAAQGSVGIEAAVLFSILFLWQLPHSLAIAWLYREDYARAGMQLLPVLEPDGRSTARQIATNCLALLAVGMLPTLLGVAGPVYFAAACALGGALLVSGLQLAHQRTAPAARRLLFATLAYLPMLLVMMAIDKVQI